MRVGIDTFTISALHLGPFASLDFIKEHGFEGAFVGGMSSLSPDMDVGKLREVKAYADARGLYTQITVTTCNPHLAGGGLKDHALALRREIETAAACGWHELRVCLGGPDDRYKRSVSWPQQLADSAGFIRALAPVLREHSSRINIETHGDCTTFEVVRIAEDVGPDVAGICLDTANVLCFVEDPVAAARRAAPYTHMTHTKDCIIFFTDTGYRRQVRPPGGGMLDWAQILPILARHAPGLTLSIEDHKWWHDVPVFDAEWLSIHPDLTREELASVMRLAWQCQQRIASGEIEDPEQYEAVPMVEQLEDRLAQGRDYLLGLLARLKLHG